MKKRKCGAEDLSASHLLLLFVNEKEKFAAPPFIDFAALQLREPSSQSGDLSAVHYQPNFQIINFSKPFFILYTTLNLYFFNQIDCVIKLKYDLFTFLFDKNLFYSVRCYCFVGTAR